MSAHPQAAQLAAAHERAQAARFDATTAPDCDYRGPVTAESIEAIAERNAARLPAAIDWLGERYVLHRVHLVRRREPA